MAKVIIMVSFELNNINLLLDWEDMSKMITKDLSTVDGFVSRDSVIGEDKKVYCLVKWDSIEQKQAFNTEFESRAEYQEMMAKFAKIANIKTMKQETLRIL